MLSYYDFIQPLLLNYLTRRAKRFLKSFSSFNLVSTGLKPNYILVTKNEKNDIEFFGNIGGKTNLITIKLC
ncbi:MAG: hypothetical protein ACFFAS_07715 [Promethearchaeota archaeon]